MGELFCEEATAVSRRGLPVEAAGRDQLRQVSETKQGHPEVRRAALQNKHALLNSKLHICLDDYIITIFIFLQLVSLPAFFFKKEKSLAILN